MTTSYPLYLMVHELAGDVVVVRYAVPEGRMPQTWTPLSDDIQKLQAADIVLFSGAGYEPWAQKLSLPRSRTVDTSSGYSDKLLHVADSITHQHGPVGQQSDRDVIPTSWLDPQLAVAQLGRVEEQLLKTAPNATDAISQRATAFRNSFDNLEHKLEQLRADSAGRKISVAVDDTDFQYLISRLAWRNQHISWAEDGTLTAEFTEQLALDPPLLILIRQDCERKRAEVLQATGVSCIAVDTCESAHGKAKAPDRLVARLSANLDRLRRGLGL